MSYPFSVKFRIFYDYHLTKKDVNLRQKICKEFHSIFKVIVEDFSDKYKYLDRFEPSLCSLDEKKQLRMNFSSMLNQDKTQSCYIIFHQHHSCCQEYFGLDELKLISQRIKKELEDNYLPYEIDEPVLFIRADDIHP